MIYTNTWNRSYAEYYHLLFPSIKNKRYTYKQVTYNLNADIPHINTTTAQLF